MSCLAWAGAPAGANYRNLLVLVDLKGLQTGSLTKVIEQNQKAGGVHRARNRNVFSWADSTAGPSGGGRIFVIK